MPTKEIFNTDAIKQAIAMFGSMEKLAAAIKGTHMSVFKWAHGKAVPSPLSCMKIEKATQGRVTKEQIRPHFDWENFSLL